MPAVKFQDKAAFYRTLSLRQRISRMLAAQNSMIYSTLFYKIEFLALYRGLPSIVHFCLSSNVNVLKYGSNQTLVLFFKYFSPQGLPGSHKLEKSSHLQSEAGLSFLDFDLVQVPVTMRSETSQQRLALFFRELFILEKSVAMPTDIQVYHWILAKLLAMVSTYPYSVNKVFQLH